MDSATQGDTSIVEASTNQPDITTVNSSHFVELPPAFLKDFHGRMFNSQSGLYVMPSDNAEFRRLNKQHYGFKFALNGLFPCPEVVNAILAPREGTQRPVILDLGCGSGIWSVEMALQFPHCEVVGLDLAPASIDKELMPPNCRLEMADVNLGLSRYHGHFDLIHVRCIGSGIGDYGAMMRDVEACLKPGGIVFFIDGEMCTYYEDMVTPFPVGQEVEEGGDPNQGSWMHRVAREIRSAAFYNGSDIDGLEDCINQGLWDHELIDPSTAKVGCMNLPLGTWAKSDDPNKQQRLLNAGSLIQENMMELSRAWHPMLMQFGIPVETLHRWSERVDEELKSGKFHMSMRWRYAWGRRRVNDTETPLIADGVAKGNHGPEPITEPTEASKVYRFFDIYPTREEAIANRDLRRLKAKDLPITMVERLRTATD